MLFRSLLTQSRYTELCPAGLTCWALDQGIPELTDAEYPLEDINQPDDLAYVIYTSGSTGQPKGVMNPHAALLNRLHWMQEAFPLDASDRVLQKTPYSFDVSVWEFFWPLMTGACLVVAKPEGHKDTGYLASLIQQQQITTLHFVPSMLQAFVAEPALADCSSIRQVFASGEALPLELAQSFMQQHPAQLHNLYGPTEAAIDVSWWDCRQAHSHGVMPIGKPIRNLEIYVLSPQQKLLPVGAVGELYIGGAGLARGYLNRDELTAETFIAHPFKAGERLYRSGDLCRYLPDGNIQYLGRIDHQVKLRGLRIELEEINAALLQQDNITGAATLLREDLATPQLVAYLTVTDAVTDSVKWQADLSTALQAVLPAYMVPAAYVVMDTLPLNANGKLDRKQLPKPELQDVTAELLPLQGAEQQLMAGLWAEVLRMDVAHIGANSHFFQLGGHSLLATMLLAKLRQNYQQVPTIRQVFETPLLSELAAQLGEPLQQQATGLTVQTRPEQLPLSYAQQRLWFLETLDEEIAEYNITSAIELQGEINPQWLQQGLHSIVQRHEILRSRILSTESGPQLVIDGSADVQLPVSQWQGDDQQWQLFCREQVSAEVALPFNLAADRLIRAQLVQRQDADNSLLLLTLHHSVADDWSMQLLIDELAACYQAYASGTQPQLEALPVQYVDYSIWQQQPAQQQLFAEQLRYWQRQLPDADYLLELPTDFIRRDDLDSSSASLELPLDAALTKQLRALAAEHDVTLYVVLMAVTQLLLGRLANQTDVRIGTPVANRNMAETLPLMGCFINTLVIRSELDAGNSFAALLQQVQQTVLTAQEHQQLPFEQLVDALLPQRELNRSPLFQVLFAMQTASLDADKWAPLQLQEIPVENPSSGFDLNWEVHDSGTDLHIRLTYKQGLFATASMQHWLDIWQRLLQQVADDSQTPLAALSLLNDNERQQQLNGWNQTQTGYPGARTISQLLAEQAQRSPEALALIAEGQQYSYQQLHAEANQLAHALRGQGVGRESIVAVCLPRSERMVLALLGIIKAGAAYLPLDPELPAARQALVIEDAAPVVLLTTTDTALPDDLTLPVWALDQTDFSQQPATEPELLNQPQDLAYLIYTSGSTGMPKGVLNEHRALVNRLNWMQEAFPLTAADRVLQKTPYSFDVSVWEFFWPLLTGASIVVARDGGHKDPAYLAELIRQQQVTTLHFVPSMLAAFVDEPQLSECSSIRQIFTSGEALPLELQQRFFARHGAELINLYGPTEAAIDVSYWRCQRDTALDFVPIGKPIANIQLYVLDNAQQLLPQGAVGELYIGGAGLARGYLNRAELTAERFISSPFAAEQRLYRTGDRCRLMADGNIQYLGRMDHQVKLRGLRIELGEIDATLQQLPALKAAVTVLREDLITAQLVAYVVVDTAADSIAVSSTEIQAQLAQTLPAYMVPGIIVSLDELPLSSNGKVDRKRLPKPDVQATAATWQAPETEQEIILCKLMQALLKLDQVGVNDNFFALGGDSILGLQLIAQAKARGLGITPKQLFQQKTLAELARVEIGRASCRERVCMFV